MLLLLIFHIASSVVTEPIQHLSQHISHIVTADRLAPDGLNVETDVGDVECRGILVSGVFYCNWIIFPQFIHIFLCSQDRSNNDTMFPKSSISQLFLKAFGYILQQHFGFRDKIWHRM